MEWLEKNFLQILSLLATVFVGASGWITVFAVLYKAKSDKKKIEADTHKTLSDAEKVEVDAQKVTVDMVLSLIGEIDELRLRLKTLVESQITEKNLFENVRRLLQQTEIVLREFLNTSHIGYWEADSMGKRNYFNEAWLEMSGMRLSEAIGDGWQKCIHPEDLDMVRRRDEGMTLVGNTLRPIRCRIINQKTGETFNVEKTLFVVYNTDQTIYKFIGRMVKIQ